MEVFEIWTRCGEVAFWIWRKAEYSAGGVKTGAFYVSMFRKNQSRTLITLKENHQSHEFRIPQKKNTALKINYPKTNSHHFWIKKDPCKTIFKKALLCIRKICNMCEWQKYRIITTNLMILRKIFEMVQKCYAHIA